MSKAITGGSWHTELTTVYDSQPELPVLQVDGKTQAHRGVFQFDAALNNQFTLTLAGLGEVKQADGVVSRHVSMNVYDSQGERIAELDNEVFDGTSAVAGFSIIFKNTLDEDTSRDDNVVYYDFSQGANSYLSVEVGYDIILGTNEKEFVTGNVFGSWNQFTLQAGFMETSMVPEPSTYAAIFGGIAFLGAVWQRRRRA